MELTRTLRELAELNRRGDDAVRKAACSGPDCPETTMGMAHAPGDRVFDTVSGQEGRILAGTSENTLV